MKMQAMMVVAHTALRRLCCGAVAGGGRHLTTGAGRGGLGTARGFAPGVLALQGQHSGIRCLVSATTACEQFKVYTRTGDKGTSSLFTGERRSKTDAVFEALGTIDEVSSFIGLALSKIGEEQEELANLKSQLYEIQCMLQDVGSHIATPPSSATEARLERTAVPDTYTEDVESWIDGMDSELPPLKNFILPGGTEISALLHCARTACRRAERRVVDVSQHDSVSDTAMKLVNRLSDFLFVAARFATAKQGAQEIIYLSATKRRERTLLRQGPPTTDA